jgi:hypothetical protein
MDRPLALTENSSHSQFLHRRIDVKNSAILIVPLLFLLSCAPKETHPLVSEWKGPHADIRTMIPACIIWYKPGPSGWVEYKKLCGTDDLRQAINGLTEPDFEQAGTGGEYKLSIVFYSDTADSLKVREVFFRLDGDTFVGPLGRSKSLGKVLLKAPDSRPYFRPADPNVVREAERALQETYHRNWERK